MKIELGEEITIYSVQEIYDYLIFSLKEPFEALTVDLTSLVELDGAGLQLLISLQKTCEITNKKCHFIFSKSLKNNLDIFGIINVLDLEVR